MNVNMILLILKRLVLGNYRSVSQIHHSNDCFSSHCNFILSLSVSAVGIVNHPIAYMIQLILDRLYCSPSPFYAHHPNVVVVAITWIILVTVTITTMTTTPPVRKGQGGR